MENMNFKRFYPDKNGGEVSMGERASLLALLPCPLKVPMERAFEQHLDMLEPAGGPVLEYLIEGNANNQLSYYPRVEQLEKEEEIPDVIISPGLNSFFYKDFVDKFISRGVFADVSDSRPKSSIEKLEMKDPGGSYTMMAMNVLVMVADHEKMGGRALPKTWEDILQPEFEKSIAIRGQKDFFCETTLLTLYNSYGLEGIQRLGRSTKYGWHPSQMVKMAGSASPDAPAVSVMPYFYAKTIRHKDKITVIWPEDGAIVSPVTMLVKKEKAEQLRYVTDFFAGAEAGKICADASFPSLHPQVDNGLPGSGVMNWLGWDFIRSNDIGALTGQLTKEFLKHYNHC